MSDAGEATVGAHLFWAEERWRGMQAQRFTSHVTHAATSPLYRGRGLEGIGAVKAADMDAVLRTLPVTTKDDLAAAGPRAWAAAPDAVREWVCTSGTSGSPLEVPLTDRDLSRLAENEAVALSLAGLGRGDLFLLSVAMDRMFVAGLAYWLGAQRLGAACIRMGPQLMWNPGGSAERVARCAKDSAKLFAIAVPTFLLAAQTAGASFAGIIGIGEPIRGTDGDYNALGRQLHERFGCPVMSTYAATETCTTFAEGPLCRGGHLNPALAVVEVLDEAGKNVGAGEVGEVVVTPLGVEGMPLVRFRTGDMAALHTDVCACGRTTPRVGPIVGRRQQLLKIRGTSVYPNAIIEAARAVAGVVDCAVVAEQEQALSDRVTVFVQASDSDAQQVREVVQQRLREALRVTPEVRFATAGEMKELLYATGSRKAQRFIDRRRGLGGAG